MESLQYTADEAERYLSEGNPGVSELIVRAALLRNPRDSKAWTVLGRLAATLGEPEMAVRFGVAGSAMDFARAVAAAPLPAVPPTPPRDPERFLLIKAWGYGFCSDVDHVLGCLLLAEITGRTPVTHWGANSLFRDEPGKDAFRYYFEPVSNLAAADLIGKGYDFYPPKWNDANLTEDLVHKHTGPNSRMSALQLMGRGERVAVSDYHTGISILCQWLRPDHPMFGRPVEDVIRYLVGRYLRPVSDLRREIDEFASRQFGTGQVIAAHLRGTDKFLEDQQHAQRMAVFPQAIDHLCAGDRNAKIFFMTDSTTLLETYRKRYGSRLVTTDAFRTNTRVGLPFLGNKEKRRLGNDVMRDIYLATRCSKFVGLGSSNVSCLIYHLREWAPGAAVMLGPMMMHIQEPSQFMSVEQLKRYFPSGQVDTWMREWK